MGENGVEVIKPNGTKWLNEKQIEEELDHSALRNITRKYPSEYRKERQELVDYGNYQPCRNFYTNSWQ